MLVSPSIVVGYPVTIMASLNERIGNQPLQFGFTRCCSLSSVHTGTAAEPVVFAD